MEKLEKLIFPIIAVVAIGAMFLVQAGTDTAVAVARIIGIVLGLLLVLGFVARSVIKFRRATQELEEMAAEAAAAEESPEAH